MEGVPIWSRALSLYWRAYYRRCAQRTEQLRCNIPWFSRRRACPIGGARARRPIRAEILSRSIPVSYTHLRAHETRHDLVCRLLLEKKKNDQPMRTKKHDSY